MDNGVLPSLLQLLNSPKKGIRKEACWTISNITAGEKNQIQAVIDTNVIPPLLALLATAEFDIRKEAAWAVSNATSGGSQEQIKYLVSQGCIPPLCELLEVADARVITVALEGLENILRAGDLEAQSNGSGQNMMATYIDEADGITKIQNLQYHENEDIYEKSVHMVETFFGVDEEEDQDIAPTADPNAFQYQFGTNASENTNMFNFGQ